MTSHPPMRSRHERHGRTSRPDSDFGVVPPRQRPKRMFGQVGERFAVDVAGTRACEARCCLSSRAAP
jgi:hypothetical protein